MGAAQYRVMEDIENYNKLEWMKKTGMQVQMMNVFSARQNDSINALMKLQYSRIYTEIFFSYSIRTQAERA
jgi:hypothetical protein